MTTTAPMARAVLRPRAAPTRAGRTTRAGRATRAAPGPPDRTGTAAAEPGGPPAGRSDAELVAGARQGDRACWQELYDRHHAVLRRRLRRFRLDGADVDDVVAHTWLMLVANIDRLTDPDRVRAWLLTTATRQAITVCASRRREQVWGIDRFDPLVDRCAVDPELQAARNEAAGVVREAVATLPEHRQRLIWALMSEDRPSYRDVARRLGVPVGSLGPTRQRCLDLLRIRLQSRGFDAGLR